MNRKTKAKWLWLFVVPLFPIFIHPWWLFVLSAVAFSFLVWRLEGKKETSDLCKSKTKR